MTFFDCIYLKVSKFYACRNLYSGKYYSVAGFRYICGRQEILAFILLKDRCWKSRNIMTRKHSVSARVTGEASRSLSTAMANLPGEKWKEIPSFEDEYLISNYGRIKSQDRWRDMGTYDAFHKGRMRKLHVTKSWGKADKKLMFIDVFISLHKDGKRYRFSVGRLVYHLFVAYFDLEDHTVIVTSKDKNRLNLHCSNLLLRKISDVASEGFAKQRRKSPFQLQIRPVTQYSMGGNKIQVYESAKAAARSLGMNPKYINGAAKNLTRVSGGYFWRYGIGPGKILLPGQPADDKNNKDHAGPGRGLKYPYLNLSLVNIPGERWAAIPDYAGAYEVSDHGRVKSRSRPQKVNISKGRIAYSRIRGRIMKQLFTKSYNGHLDETSFHLSVILTNDKGGKKFQVAQLVHRAYGAPETKSEKPKPAILHKDGNTLNNHIANLSAINVGERIKRSYEQKRRRSYFADLSKKERRKYAAIAAEANKVPVVQYNREGKRIRLFDSIISASQRTGVSKTGISNVLHGRYTSAGGFLWKKY
jgi:hypothetical protein